jgi:iron(III) transport system permease protein
MMNLARSLPKYRNRFETRWNWEEAIARGILLLILAALFTFLLAPLWAILVNVVLDQEGHFVGLAHFREYL